MMMETTGMTIQRNRFSCKRTYSRDFSKRRVSIVYCVEMERNLTVRGIFLEKPSRIEKSSSKSSSFMVRKLNNWDKPLEHDRNHDNDNIGIHRREQTTESYRRVLCRDETKSDRM